MSTTPVNPLDAKVGDTILATIDQIEVTVTAVTPCRDGAIRISGVYHILGGSRTTGDFYFYPPSDAQIIADAAVQSVNASTSRGA